jgi:hypothetical protein
MTQGRKNGSEPNKVIDYFSRFLTEAKEMGTLHDSYPVVIVVEGIVTFIILTL